jgi:hypothetical protein
VKHSRAIQGGKGDKNTASKKIGKKLTLKIGRSKKIGN